MNKYIFVNFNYLLYESNLKFVAITVENIENLETVDILVIWELILTT